jgi:hypothetical protein
VGGSLLGLLIARLFIHTIDTHEDRP